MICRLHLCCLQTSSICARIIWADYNILTALRFLFALLLGYPYNNSCSAIMQHTRHLHKTYQFRPKTVLCRSYLLFFQTWTYPGMMQQRKWRQDNHSHLQYFQSSAQLPASYLTHLLDTLYTKRGGRDPYNLRNCQGDLYVAQLPVIRALKNMHAKLKAMIA